MRSRSEVLPADDPRHGRASTYRFGLCHCARCYAALERQKYDTGDGPFTVVKFEGSAILEDGRAGRVQTDLHVVDERGRTQRVFSRRRSGGPANHRWQACRYARLLNAAAVAQSEQATELARGARA